MQEGFIPGFSYSEKNEVLKRLDPSNNRACNNNILWSSGDGVYSGNYKGHSLKRSYLDSARFVGATFDHTSFAGSILSNIQFDRDCKFDSVYAEKSMLANIIFASDLNIINCNFSDCRINNLRFQDALLRSTYFNDSILEDCTFENCTIRSTMFDNTLLSNCRFSNCDMRNLNIEFCRVFNTEFTNSVFPYFQLPYIIGIFDNNEMPMDIYVARTNDEKISANHYLDQIQDSIIFFTSQHEYFPMANLYYLKGEEGIALSCIISGIKSAIIKSDIRMVERFCTLGQRYQLLTISDLKEILNQVDEKVKESEESVFYGALLRQFHQLKATIFEDDTKSKLEFTVSTTYTQDEFGNAGQFCMEMDALVQGISNDVTTSYKLSHNSPIEIILTCLGTTADLISVGQAINNYISSKMKKSSMIEQVNEFLRESMDYKEKLSKNFDEFEDNLKQSNKSERKYVVKKFRSELIENFNERIDSAVSLMFSMQSNK